MGHYFVPQAHLQRFSVDGKPKVVWMYDKQRGKFSCSGNKESCKRAGLACKGRGLPESAPLEASTPLPVSQHYIRVKFFYVAMQFARKIKPWLFKIQKMIGHVILFQLPAVIDLFNTFHFITFGQFFQYACIEVYPVQPLLWITE
jgi:hypothetical protein